MAVTQDVIINTKKAVINVKNVEKQVKRVETQAKKSSRGVDNFSSSLYKAGGAFLAIQVGARIVGAVSAKLVEGAKAGIDFARSIAEIETLLPGTERNTARLNDTLLQLSNNYGQSAQSQAKGFYDIVSAGVQGFSNQMDVLNTTNKIAIGGITDTATATNLLVTTMNAFQSQGATATKVADVLFTTVKQGVTTIPQLASAMGQVNAIASNAGVKLEEVGAAMAVLTKNGLRSTQAATALKAGITAFSKPTAEAKKLIKKLGIDFSTTAIKTKGFETVMRDLRKATGGNVAVLEKLFSNVRARTSLIPLLSSKWEEFNKQLANFKDTSGAADAAFKRITETAGFQIDRLNTAFTNLTAAVTSILDKELAGYFKDMADSANRGGVIFEFFLKTVKWTVKGLIFLEQAFVGVQTTVQAVIAVVTKLLNVLTLGALSDAVKAVDDVWEIYTKRLGKLHSLQGKVSKAFDRYIKGNAVAASTLAEDLKKLTGAAGDAQGALNDVKPPKPDKDGMKLENQLANLQKKGDEVAARDEEARYKRKVAAQKEALGEIRALNQSAFGDYQAFQIAEATVATYSAATKALAAFPPPASFIAAAAAVAAGIANIAKIRAASSQAGQASGQYQQGGIVPGNKFEGDRVLARVNSGEMILNRQQQGRLFESINAGNSGGNSNITINVSSITGDIPQRSLDKMIDQIRERVIFGNKRFV